MKVRLQAKAAEVVKAKAKAEQRSLSSAANLIIEGTAKKPVKK